MLFILVYSLTINFLSVTDDGCCSVLVRDGMEYEYVGAWYSDMSSDPYETRYGAYMNQQNNNEVIFYLNGIWYAGMTGFPTSDSGGWGSWDLISSEGKI